MTSTSSSLLETAPAEVEALASRLRMTVGRLARRLRDQSPSSLPFTAFSTLATIGRSSPMTPSELALAERVARPTMTAVTQLLRDRGLIERQADPDDGRCVHLVITREGRRALDAERRRKTSYLGRLLTELDAGQLRLLSETVGILEHLTTVPMGDEE